MSHTDVSFSESIETWLLAGLIFTTPLNLFLKLAESTAYVNGIFVDYLIPKLYIADIFVLALLFTFLWQQKPVWTLAKSKKWIRQNWLFILFVCLFTLSQAWSAHPFSAWWFEGKLVILGLIAIFLLGHSQLWQKTIIKGTVLFTLLFQSLLGLYQFFTQTNLLPYRYLGETNFGSFAGLATQIIQGRELILPYGTTAHPNVLAGVMIAYGLIAWKLFHDQQLVQTTVATCVVVIVGLSFSTSAQLALILTLGYLLFPHHVFYQQPIRLLKYSVWVCLSIPLCLFILNLYDPHNLSIHRRDTLNQATMQMIVRQPLGVGLNNFTAQSEQYLPTTEVVRFLQPVHHTPLLILAEVGVINSILIGIWIWHSLKRTTLLNKTAATTIFLLSPILSLDHYLFSLQTGILTVVVLTIFQYHFSATIKDGG